MLIPLLMLAGISAATPFPIDDVDPELNRLRDAWTSSATTDRDREEIEFRLREESTMLRPNWRAVADGYFAWRGDAPIEREPDTREILRKIERAVTAIATEPQVCSTTTEYRKDAIFDFYTSQATTVCMRPKPEP